MEEDVPEQIKKFSRTAIETLQVKGPFNAAQPAAPESYKKIFVCGHTAGEHEHKPGCARLVVTELVRRAFRRPVAEADVAPRIALVDLARKNGDSFEAGIQLALQSILTSPNFLFRVEHNVTPGAAVAVRKLNDFELASRLSYFLWSSMPDETLFRLARSGTLQRPDVLRSQVKRMVLDPKSDALVESFAGQWLQLRNLEVQKPDPSKFPAFDNELRAAMMQESRMFFQAMIREDHSLLDLIDSKYTFLNERLAKHYGISGVQGDQFRRVDLTGDERGGILGQGAVLTVTSYGNRTSPVLRGKWLLSNFLGAAPPPPPPNVPSLKEDDVGTTVSLRERLQQHRANAVCASCHQLMDPLGFALDNYDAIGAWRTSDGKLPIDASGKLPDGTSFEGPRQLKTILIPRKTRLRKSSQPSC